MGFRLRKRALWATAGIVLLFGCANKPTPVPEMVPLVQTQTPSDKPPVHEAPPEKEPAVPAIALEPPPSPLPRPVVRPAEKPLAGPMEKPVEVVKEAPPEPRHDGLEVSRELYTRTFDELESRIREWSEIIARKDFDAWCAALSRRYVDERGSQKYLAELSRSPRLREQGIVLRTLEDYFVNVVVPARVDAALDRIAFVDDNRVKAYANVGGELAILYYAIREDGEWKIGINGS